MPGVTPTGSLNLAFLDSKIVANLCDGNFYVDVTPSIYIGSGADNVLGAKVQIKNPYGVVVKEYDASYEISPALSGAMDAVVSFPIPTQAGAYQTGQYLISVEMTDADGKTFVVQKTVRVCPPDKNYSSRKYGYLSAKMKADCKNGKLYVIADTVPTYNGFIAQTQAIVGQIEYPTSSELAPADIVDGNFSVTLFEGVYKFTGEVCAEYNYGDNVSANVKYKFKKEHNVRCLIDECCILSKLVELHVNINSACTDAEKSNIASITVDALRLYETIKLSANCGEDPSDFVDELEKLLGCKCTCNCADGAPIIGTSPASDIIIQGCNVSESQSGLTKTYTINNYDYELSVVENGGALVVNSITIDGCTKKQQLTFSIETVYSQIKNLANNNTEADAWAAIINKSLRNINPLSLGVTLLEWNALTFSEKIQLIIDKMNACCADCSATIVNPTVTQSGADVILTWGGNAASYQVFVDGNFYGSQLSTAQNVVSGLYSLTLLGLADGKVHDWVIIAYCDDKSQGAVESGDFQFLGCPTVMPVMLTGVTAGYVSDADCPFDLTSLIDPLNPETAEWHTANNTSPSTLVANPTSVSSGSYYVFNKTGDGCFSASQKVTIVCSATTSCTAPQNLLVGHYAGDDFFIQFQSAVYPPPGNSYTVKRRLYSDPDVDGSYVTIGTPTWNASLSRWVISDGLIALANTLYVYRAISNCGSTAPYTDFVYVALNCPTITLTPGDTSVAYSFVPVATTVQLLLQIYDSTGLVLIKTDTYNPAYPNPITGTFEYLDPGTTYKVKLIVVFGGATEYEYKCSVQTVTTTAP